MSRILETQEDQHERIRQDLRGEYAGQCCDGTNLQVYVYFAARFGWRGWVVICLICGETIAELDEV